MNAPTNSSAAQLAEVSRMSEADLLAARDRYLERSKTEVLSADELRHYTNVAQRLRQLASTAKPAKTKRKVPDISNL